MKHLIYPPALKQGDTIGILAPSSWYDAPLIKEATQFFEDAGFKLKFHPQINERYGQMAGTTDKRVSALHDYFKDPDIKAILPIGAGNGAIHLLDHLDYDLIKANPKILMGFSDATILINAITVKTGLITYHGPTFARFVKIEPEWQQQALAVLTGQNADFDIKSDLNLSGTIYGGCFTAFQTLIGTPYAPDMNNAILIMEDANDHTSRYDRVMGHMKQAGWLGNLNGIMSGEFINSLESSNPFGFTIDEIIHNNAPDIPHISNAPFGHGDKLCTLPIGAKLHINNGTLSFPALKT